MKGVQHQNVSSLVIVVAGFVALLALMRLLIGFFMAKMSEWKKLSDSFSFSETDHCIKVYKKRNGQCGKVAYSRALTVGIYTSGIKVQNSFPFHPPVFIPWNRIKEGGFDAFTVIIQPESNPPMEFFLPKEALGLIEEAAPELVKRMRTTQRNLPLTSSEIRGAIQNVFN